MGFVLNLQNWHQMCLNLIYCYLFTKFTLFALTTNAIIIFIMYLYMYLLKSLYLLVCIVVYIFIDVTCIYFNCISTVFIGHVFIYFFIYLLFIGLDLFSLFNTCAIKFIEGKFYFEGRACYIGKIMPTCIE